MQELEKILEEIDERIEHMQKAFINNENMLGYLLYKKTMEEAKDIIRKHINEGWISVDKELPPNAKHKGALCPRYQVMTKYGVTEGWYNPDYESWYVLCWFMGADYLETEIDFEKGTYPKVVRCENSVNDKYSIVLTWKPLTEPYCIEE